MLGGCWVGAGDPASFPPLGSVEEAAPAEHQQDLAEHVSSSLLPALTPLLISARSAVLTSAQERRRAFVLGLHLDGSALGRPAPGIGQWFMTCPQTMQ